MEIKEATKSKGPRQSEELKQRSFPESAFGGFSRIDGTIPFYIRIHELVTPDSIVLDVGCGRGEYDADPVRVRRDLRIFKGKCRTVIGIDLDEAAGENPFLDRFSLIEEERWPVDDESIDVCICDNAMEHVQDPDAFFKEVFRVLRPGGYICLRTPNSMSYFGILSRLIPNRAHTKVLNKVQEGRQDEDVFPTYYRCNTVWKLRRALARNGFDHAVYAHETEPSYLSFSRFLYVLGVLYSKIVPSVFHTKIFAFGKKR